MASRSRLVYRATLALLLLTCRHSALCDAFTVDPPEDVKIIDPGHLGHLEITWKPPASLMNRSDCTVLYQLEHFNTYSNSWDTVEEAVETTVLHTTESVANTVIVAMVTNMRVPVRFDYTSVHDELTPEAIRTSRRSYQAQFDLMKDIRVKVYTLLTGPCTNNNLIKSANCTEKVIKPNATGVPGSAVQEFVCMYHNMNYTMCTWKSGDETLANSKLHLYFWHKELEQTQECRNYIVSSGVRSGCNFTQTKIPVFTDVIFCVNGSSDQGPIEPTFVMLQLQNHVKPGTTEKLRLQTGSDKQLVLDWDPPAGKVPGHCLEWEVECSQVGPDGKQTLKPVFTKETSLTLSGTKEKNCFRVRSKLHKYCAERSFWSEWSHETCHPDVEKKEVEPEPGSEPGLDMVPLYVYIAVAIITVLVLVLCVGAVLKARRSTQEKKQGSPLSSLLGGKAVPVTKA